MPETCGISCEPASQTNTSRDGGRVGYAGNRAQARFRREEACLSLVGNAAMLERLIALAVLSTVINPSGARAEATSPEMVACHKQAAQRYIADFRQVGTPQESFDGSPIIVTKFQNDNEQYEKYLAECMKREKKSLARPPAYSAGEIWLSEQSQRATNVLAFAL